MILTYVLVISSIVILIVTYSNIGPISGKRLHRGSIINGESDDSNGGNYYNFSNYDVRLYAYSAFYDDRPSLLAPPVIRVIVISDDIEELSNRNITQFYCILHNKAKDIVVQMVEKPKRIGYGWLVRNTETKEYIYTCPTVKGIIPTSVSIVLGLDEYRSSGVPVTLPDKTKERKDFCACVQAVYGTLDPYRIIEWMELQKILGVSLVGIYILSTSETIRKVFRHYSDEGFVDLRTMNYIFANKSNDDENEFWLHLSPAINDCIYRHMYECHRVLVIDLDEFIMPRKHQNLSGLISFLDRTFAKTETPCFNFAFRNNYFFLDFPPDETIANYSTFLRFRKKVTVSDVGESTKSIIDPQVCTHMHNHFCWYVTANYTKYDISAHIDPDIAVNQHYKKCHRSAAECKTLMENVTQDDVMMPFKERLIKNVDVKLKRLL